MPQGRLNIINYPKPGDYVRIRIKDTGDGIRAEDIPNAFIPFFSTRNKEKGSGLGLSIAYAAAKRHGGSLTLESEPGKGTTASVYLPAEPVGETSKIEHRYAETGV